MAEVIACPTQGNGGLGFFTSFVVVFVVWCTGTKGKNLLGQ
jgi:hypothetical protein